MNILTDFEAHKRDEDFDREDAKRHRETCSPAGSCYIPYVENVRGEQHYCDVHRPDCTVCHRRKAPQGRSIPVAMAGFLCDRDCAGYYEAPRPGQNWPEEKTPPKGETR